MRHFESIEDLSNYYGVPLKHPLISLLKYEEAEEEDIIRNEALSFEFYTISFVNNFNGYVEIDGVKFEGERAVLHFIRPDQQYSCNSKNPWKGYQVLIHPNIYARYFSHKGISNYDFFSYEANESLSLDPSEKQTVETVLQMAWEEFNREEDNFSIPIVLSHISTLLNLSERFYARQFERRRALNNQLSSKFFKLLKGYYRNSKKGDCKQPSVQFFADQLAVTANYLSDTVKHQSGQSALTHIHEFIIAEAKTALKKNKKTVAEIAYDLGFEYPNYFSRLFKKKTQLSPSAYRKSVKST